MTWKLDRWVAVRSVYGGRPFFAIMGIATFGLSRIIMSRRKVEIRRQPILRKLAFDRMKFVSSSPMQKFEEF